MPDPIVLPVLLLTGAGLLGRSGSVKGGGPTPASDGLWTFPVSDWRGYLPTVSDGYSAEETATHRDHHGVDIMYRRKAGGPDSMWVAGLSGTGDARRANGTKNYFMPDGMHARAARDGTLWHVGKGGHGIFVVIDHGAPFATFYTHLSSTPFEFLQRGAGAVRVRRGQPIGVIGYSPLDTERIMHLHFEVWYKGGAESHVDPWPLLERAPVPNWGES